MSESLEFEVELPMAFAEAKDATRDALTDEGFGILSELPLLSRYGLELRTRPPGRSNRALQPWLSEYTYAATAHTCAPLTVAAGMGAECCLGRGTPLVTSPAIAAYDPSMFSHSESVRFGARAVPLALAPWQAKQVPVPLNTLRPRSTRLWLTGGHPAATLAETARAVGAALVSGVAAPIMDRPPIPPAIVPPVPFPERTKPVSPPLRMWSVASPAGGVEQPAVTTIRATLTQLLAIALCLLPSCLGIATPRSFTLANSSVQQPHGLASSRSAPRLGVSSTFTIRNLVLLG